MFLVSLLFQFNHLTKEIEPEQRWFAPLPGKNHFAAVLPFNALANVRFQDFVGDAELVGAPKQLLFVKVVAVRAIEITD
jgi:hypothetical protein